MWYFDLVSAAVTIPFLARFGERCAHSVILKSFLLCRAEQCSTSMPQYSGLGRSNAITRGVLLGLSIA